MIFQLDHVHNNIYNSWLLLQITFMLKIYIGKTELEVPCQWNNHQREISFVNVLKKLFKTFLK